MVKSKFKVTILGLVLALLFGVQTFSSVSSATGPTIGLGVSGQYPMVFAVEQDVRLLEGYIRVINDGGTMMGYYNISAEGQIVDLKGWNVTLNPKTFTLNPDQSQKVEVVIKCPEVIGEFTGGIRVSAYVSGAGMTGTGVAEVLVPVKIELLQLGMVIQATEYGTVTYINRPEIFTLKNPAIIDSKVAVGCVIAITGISQPCKITVENITSLPTEVTPPSVGFRVVGNYANIAVNTTLTLNATIKMYYKLEDLAAYGLDENTLKIYYWNETLHQWAAMTPSYLNKTDRYIGAVVNHFGLWALIGTKTLTMMSCTPSKSEIYLGETITVSGSINPSVGSVMVTLNYTKPNGTWLMRTATTDSTGVYTDTYTPPTLGAWKVTASWAGDTTHESVSSPIASFTITQKPIWIEILFIALIASVLLIIVAVAVILIRRR